MKVLRRSVRGSSALVAAAASAAVFAASAPAAVYCVDMASAAGCDHVESPGGTAGLAAAFAAANGDAAADTIEVGAGVYTGPFAATAGGGSLTVIGAGSTGAAVTTLTVTVDSQTVLALAVAGSSVSHVHLELPNQTGDTALDLNGAASDVLIDDPSGSTQAIGVDVNHPDSFSGTIRLGDGTSSTGINRTANGSGAESVSDSTISAIEGISATSGNWAIDHSKVAALNYGVQAATGNNGTGTPAIVAIDDSLIRVTTTDISTCGAIVPCFALGVSGSSTITGDRVTVVGADQQIAGAWALGAISGETAKINLNSTVVSGFTPALKCSQSNGGTATLTADYSDFATPVATAGGCAAPPTAHNTSAPPDFVTGGFQLKWDSPLIDASDPHAAFVPHPTDLDGNPRVVDGNGDGAAVLDIGAFEYQRRAPSVTAQSVAQAPIGANTPFAVKQASDPDPGDTLTFSWSFDDGGSATGTQVTHVFATPGPHTGTVTATDPTGLTATSTATVVILTRPTRTTTTPTPRISDLRQTHTRWREGSKLARLGRRSRKPPVGTTFSFALNTSAALKLIFTRSASGRRVGKKCDAPSHANRRKHACNRTITSGTVTFQEAGVGMVKITFQGRLSQHKKLRPGRYKLTIAATNAVGRTTSHALTFLIIVD
ncbi:MAG TPA: PKD domain-containing protein [Solirubrobacteraceae bacterium]|nr:PKD domain-containing protein [Solirubrobacteraceae bacterium]